MRARKPVLLAVVALSAGVQWVAAEVRPNPYQPIIDRNPFGLRPPPQPQVETPKEEQKPPPNVKLTGISNLFQKRALLEVTEQGNAKPGQPATGTVHRPILAETEGAFGIEVLAIDVEKNIVRIRNNGTESELTFEAPKPSGGPVAPHGGPPLPGPRPRGGTVNPNSAQAQQPTVIPSPNTPASSGAGISLYGGDGNAAAANNAGVTTYGGGAPAAAASAPGAENGLRTIPARTMRTPTSNEQQQQQVDPAQQRILMEAQRLRAQQEYNRTGHAQPPLPLPPTPTPPQNGGGQPQQPY